MPQTPLAIAPSQSQVQSALRSFLLSVLPAGNAVFRGNVAGTTLTVEEMVEGSILDGDAVLGLGVAAGTFVQSQIDGDPGGVGTYKVTPSQNTAQGQTPTTMSTGVDVIEWLDNLVPEPPQPDFVLMSTTLRRRIETNTDTSADCKFTGSITNNVMTVTEMLAGKIALGAPVFGANVMAGTFVVDQLTGDLGGIGTYRIAPAAQDVSERTLSAGSKAIKEPVEITVQLSFHGPNSANFAQTVSAVFRDEKATEQFAAQNPNFGVVPLYADDAKQVPFVNDQELWENRWIVEAMLQADSVVSVPQQFMDSVGLEVVSVDERYPP